MDYKCNNCGIIKSNNGGSLREVGMLSVYKSERDATWVYYCFECAKEIAMDLIDEI